MTKAKKNSAEYWAERIAAGTWEIYNSTEEKNRKLLEMYKDASQRITNELYRLAEKLQKQGFKNTDVHRNNQLVKLNVEILKAIKQLGGNAEVFEQKSMFSAFAENYEMIGDMIGGVDFAMPNKGAMEKMMQRPWRGDDFSSRLWKNTKKLSSVLNDVLQHGIQQGKTVTEIAVDIDNQMQAGFNAAHRLVRTETMHVLSESSKEGYKAAGVKKIQFWAAEDERTCDQCGKLHGKIYDFDSAPVLPLHPNCRCTYLPVMELAEKNFEESVAKKAGSGIMEMTRKNNNSREGFRFISDKTFDDLTISAKKKGAVIVRGTDEAEEHLEKLNAAASNVGDVLIFRKDVCISEVLEEVHHFEQNLEKMNDDKGEPLRSILNEIEAKQFLLNNADKYKIPRKEVELTKNQLKSYQKQLDGYTKAVDNHE